MRSLLGSLFLCLVLATGAKANCYVLQNNTDHEQKWSFSYNTSIGPGQLTALTMAPHDHYPRDGQWCWNDTGPWQAVVRVARGSYRPSWSGVFTMGAGGDASPSGVYALEPVAEVEPSAPSRPQASAAPAAPATAMAPAMAMAPVSAGFAPSIACVDEICDVLFQDGHVAYTDTNRPTVNSVAALVGFHGPGAISCTARLKQPDELCVVIDGTGQTWKGPMRPGAGAWTLWTKPPRN